jgi:hypothetical protein
MLSSTKRALTDTTNHDGGRLLAKHPLSNANGVLSRSAGNIGDLVILHDFLKPVGACTQAWHEATNYDTRSVAVDLMQVGNTGSQSTAYMGMW